MTQREALLITVQLADQLGMPERPGSDLGLAHLREMVEALPENASPEKVGRWLGWAQCALVSAGVGATLEDMKAINEIHVDDGPDELRAVPEGTTEHDVVRDHAWQMLWNQLVEFSERFRKQHGHSPNEAARTDFLTSSGYQKKAPEPCSTPGCVLGRNHGGDRCNTFDRDGHP